MTLDDYINLKSRVETLMKIVDLSASGGENPISSDEEKNDLEYRKQQLQRLMNEVVDIEEMNTGIFIMDLGLNEFRLDLLEYMKGNQDIAYTPYGMHAIVGSTDMAPRGVIYVLKNLSNGVNVHSQNRLHPFNRVYLSETGEVVCNHLSPKKMLDLMRYLCKGKSEPIREIYRSFNQETHDGRNEATLY